MKWICSFCETQNNMERNTCSHCGWNVNDFVNKTIKNKKILHLIDERNNLKNKIKELEKQVDELTKQTAKLIKEKSSLKRKMCLHGSLLS